MKFIYVVIASMAIFGLTANAEMSEDKLLRTITHLHDQLVKLEEKGREDTYEYKAIQDKLREFIKKGSH